MATNNSENSQFANNSDGFGLGGGTTARTLTVTGANMTLTGSGTNVFTFPAATDTLVGRASTDTLTNKTLTTPVISSITNTGTLTLPTSTDTLVGRATTDTLTNKTLTSPVINQFGTASGLGAAWTSFSPTWAGITIGNATVTAGYMALGKVVNFRIIVVCGTTTALAAGTSDTTVSLPVTAASGNVTPLILGSFFFLHASTPRSYHGDIVVDNTTTAFLYLTKVSGADIISAGFNATNASAAFSSGDTIALSGFYEAA